MCGITGIAGPCPDRAAVVGRMTDSLVHRGPDDSGFLHDGQFSFGQRRLSIIDLAGGRQPITSEDDQVVLVCNGEIYNSPELRERLIKAGHRFKTATDVEVIIHLYEEYGRDCVHMLRGMFAFALWDRRERRLLLARDHMGQKPLFFAIRDGALYFASEAKAILASGRFAPRIDLEGLWHYMSLRFIPDRYSLFEDVQKLPAANTLEWQDGRFELARYWDPQFTSKISGSAREIEDGLDQVLRETVRCHLLSDVRVGAFLSGGIDSSTVAAMMAGLCSEPVPVFSVGVREQSFDELPYARMVVNHYGMEGHEHVASADLIHLIPKMIGHMDEPSDPFGVGVYLVSRLARQTVKVVLTGDGGDENFAGYDRYAGQRLADYYALLPAWLRREVIGRVIRLIPDSFGYKSLAQKARWLNDVSFFESGERYAQSMSFLRFTGESKAALFTARAQRGIEVANSEQKILRYFDAENASELVDRMLYTDLMTRMPDHLLVIADRMTMAHSLEGRAPLVDHRLVEYAASIPATFKLHGRQLKYILRRVAARYLPRELIDRPKQGFGFPIALWMRTSLSGFLRALFSESRFVELGLFEKREIDKLLAEHLSGKADHNFRLWILLNLELWYRLYFEGLSQDQMRELTERLANA